MQWVSQLISQELRKHCHVFPCRIVDRSVVMESNWILSLKKIHTFTCSSCFLIFQAVLGFSNKFISQYYESQLAETWNLLDLGNKWHRTSCFCWWMVILTCQDQWVAPCIKYYSGNLQQKTVVKTSDFISTGFKSSWTQSFEFKNSLQTWSPSSQY